MSGQHEDQSPINLTGTMFYEVDNITVFEFYPLDDGQGEPTQLHLSLTIQGAEDTPFVIRFRSPRGVDELIVALMTHRKNVWG